MVASRKTIAKIYKVLCKHLDADKIMEVLSDLEEVKGNRSFTETVYALNELHLGRLTSKAWDEWLEPSS